MGNSLIRCVINKVTLQFIEYLNEKKIKVPDGFANISKDAVSQAFRLDSIMEVTTPMMIFASALLHMDLAHMGARTKYTTCKSLERLTAYPDHPGLPPFQVHCTVAPLILILVGDSSISGGNQIFHILPCPVCCICMMQ